MLHPNRIDNGLWVGLFHSSLNIPINYPIIYHPMVLLPSFASSNIADLLSKPLPASTHRRFLLALGDDPTTPLTTSVATATVDSATVAPPTLVATTIDPLTAVVNPAFHPNSVPVALDTGASFSRTPFASDFALEITQAPYGLIRSALETSVVSKVASTPIDPYTLITGEDVSVDPIDLSSPDITTIAIGSDSGPPFIKVHFDVRQFGTASLTFIFSPNWSLIKVFVTPTQVDWIHWVPLPRLTPTESYLHIFGRDYLQALALLHLIPIWIYYLLHFVVNLEE